MSLLSPSLLLAALLAFFAAACTPERESDRAEGSGTAASAEIQKESTPLSYEERRGQRLFAHYCAVCHGERGAGDGFNAWNLHPRPRDLSDPSYQRAVSDEWIGEVITQGGRGVNKSNLMPAWGSTLTEDEVAELVAFSRTLAHQFPEH